MDNYTVYLVDDDAGVLKALSRLLRAKGYEVKPYLRPQEFLNNTMRRFLAVPCWIL